jgi:hypothetical protein
LVRVPGAISARLGAHLYLVVKLGTTAPPWLRADRKPKDARSAAVEALPNGSDGSNGNPA